MHNLSGEIIAALTSGILAIIGWFVGTALFGPKQIAKGKLLPEPALDPALIEIPTPRPYKSGLANALFRAWDFDKLYHLVFVRPYRFISRGLSAVDEYIVDGFVEACSVILQLFHGFFVTLQNARVGRYAVFMLAGAALIAVLLISKYSQGTL